MHTLRWMLLLMSLILSDWVYSADGIQRQQKLFVLAVGYAGEPNMPRVMTDGPDGLRAQYYCLTCKTDAQLLRNYFQAFDQRPMTGVDSVFIYSLTDSRTTLDGLYAVFDTLRRRVGADDYFVFYYASSSWLTQRIEGRSDWESYYALNPDLIGKKDLSQGGFTLRHLKSLTDRLLADNQLIVFDAGNGHIIQNDFYRNFFSDNLLEAGFGRKNRIILCPQTASFETIDEKDGLTKGDLVRVISSMPDELNILTLLEIGQKEHTNSQQFQAVFKSDIRSKTKLFMQAFWSEQLKTYAQIKILREYEYLQLLARIKPGKPDGKRGFGLDPAPNPESVDTLQSNRSKKALIIATSVYQSEQWSTLKNPISDGDSIAALLSRKYGYVVSKKFNATREELLQSIDDLAGESAQNPYNQYIVYIAGHGFYDPRQKAGYLVCRDSKSIQDVNRPGTVELSSYIDYSTLFRRLGTDLNRIVMMVDVCFGGASYNNLPGSQEPVDPSQEQKKGKQPYKKVLASGVTEVDDFVRAESGLTTRNSPFATKLLNALREGKKEVLDFDSVYGSLINSEPKLKPKPVQFAFGKTALSGEFIF